MDAEIRALNILGFDIEDYQHAVLLAVVTPDYVHPCPGNQCINQQCEINECGTNFCVTQGCEQQYVCYSNTCISETCETNFTGCGFLVSGCPGNQPCDTYQG